MAQTERTTDGKYKFSDPQLIAIAKASGDQAFLFRNLNHGDIGIWICQHSRRRQDPAIEAADRNVGQCGVFDHVPIRQDVVLAIDLGDDPRPCFLEGGLCLGTATIRYFFIDFDRLL